MNKSFINQACLINDSLSLVSFYPFVEPVLFFGEKNPAILTSRLANFTHVAWMSVVSFSLTSGEMGKERRAKWNEEKTESSGTQANSGEAWPQIVESKG